MGLPLILFVGSAMRRSYPTSSERGAARQARAILIGAIITGGFGLGGVAITLNATHLSPPKPDSQKIPQILVVVRLEQPAIKIPTGAQPTIRSRVVRSADLISGSARPASGSLRSADAELANARARFTLPDHSVAALNLFEAAFQEMPASERANVDAAALSSARRARLYENFDEAAVDYVAAFERVGNAIELPQSASAL